MPNDTDSMALALSRLLHEATDGEAMQWHPIRRCRLVKSFPRERGLTQPRTCQ
jgi:hypothetical protein